MAREKGLVEAVAVLRKATARRRGKFALGTAIDRAVMQAHPVGIHIQGIKRTLVEHTASSRANVHQKIATRSNRVNEHLDELLWTLPRCLIPMIAPRAAKGLTRLPDNWLPVNVNPFPWLILLWRMHVRLIGE